MRAKVKISKLYDNPHKLYYTCINKLEYGYFKQWIPKKKNDFNNEVIFEKNMTSMVDSHVINIIDIEHCEEAIETMSL